MQTCRDAPFPCEHFLKPVLGSPIFKNPRREQGDSKNFKGLHRLRRSLQGFEEQHPLYVLSHSARVAIYGFFQDSLFKKFHVYSPIARLSSPFLLCRKYHAGLSSNLQLHTRRRHKKKSAQNVARPFCEPPAAAAARIFHHEA